MIIRKGIRRLSAGALLGAGLLLGSGARADDTALVGLFEGHGIAPPRDRARARAAIAAAQRIRTVCTRPYYGEGSWTILAEPCSTGGTEVAALGPDAAAALLDVMDEPLHWVDPDSSRLSTLLDALASTGRQDLVPVLIIALERLDTRVRVFGESGDGWEAINAVLTQLTFLELAEQPWRSAGEAAAGWRAFWTQSTAKARAVRRREGLARARQHVRATDTAIATQAAIVLARSREARAEGIAALERIVPTRGCAQYCREAERLLRSAKPRGGGMP